MACFLTALIATTVLLVICAIRCCGGCSPVACFSTKSSGKKREKRDRHDEKDDPERGEEEFDYDGDNGYVSDSRASSVRIRGRKLLVGRRK